MIKLKMKYTVEEIQEFKLYLRDRIKNKVCLIRVDCPECALIMVISYTERPLGFVTVRDGVADRQPFAFRCPGCGRAVFPLFTAEHKTVKLEDAF